jgi:hypothetical protein
MYDIFNVHHSKHSPEARYGQKTRRPGSLIFTKERLIWGCRYPDLRSIFLRLSEGNYL